MPVSVRVGPVERDFDVRDFDVRSTAAEDVTDAPECERGSLRAGAALDTIDAPDAVSAGEARHPVSAPLVYSQSPATRAPRVAGTRIEAQRVVRTVHRGRKRLLDAASLTIEPGECVVIIGGNGAGKSTLMDSLAGLRPPQEGRVLYDGVDIYQRADWLRSHVGYVPQADIVHRALTVERALSYAAQLRLGGRVSPRERDQRIERVVEEADLLAQRRTRIGSLSGGERKRVNLAVELLADPPALFLDEPNAALDLRHRDEMRALLRALADRGRTIVLISHFLEDIEVCDRVVVMGGGGRICYAGSPRDALQFFDAPSFAQVYTLVERPEDAARWQRRFQQAQAAPERLAADATAGVAPREAGEVARAASPVVDEDVTTRDAPPLARFGRRRRDAGARGPSSLAVLLLLIHRYVETLARDRVNIALLLLQAPLIAAALAALSDHNAFVSNNGPIPAQKVLFILAIISIWFGTSNSIREICKEADIYRRERLTGLGIVPYVLSKVCVMGALCAVQTLALLLIVLAKTGAPPTGRGLIVPAFVEFYLTLTAAGVAGVALGLCVSALVDNPDKAMTLAPLLLLPQLLLGNVLFPVNGPIQYLADATTGTWAMQSLGATADLNRLYYTVQARAATPTPQAGDAANAVQRQAGAQATSPSSPQAGTPGSSSGVFAGSPELIHYRPADYDTHPAASHYTLSTAHAQPWADAWRTRKERLLSTWGTLAFQALLLIALTIALLRARDPVARRLPLAARTQSALYTA